MSAVSTAQPPSAIAPRWAAYVAAASGLEYAIVKVTMAVRGQLGVVGHPAPAAVTRSFHGNVAVAQLGNAAFGVLTILLALAFVQRWGRRVPAVVLAAGAGVALVAGVAGTAVVGASLVGLREDHGQWGIDSLLLGVPGLAAWFALAGAGARATGLLRPVPGPRAAQAAAAGCVAYGVLKLYWALGGEVLMRQAPLPAHAIRAMLDRDSGAVAGHWASFALAVVGVALALATTRGRRLPRPLAVWLPALIAVLMLARVGYAVTCDVAALTGHGAGHDTHAWDLALWSPLFALWGTSWALTARAAHRHGSTERRPLPSPSAGAVAAAWGVLFAVVHAYWAAGGAVGMHGDPADTVGAQLYIGVVALVGLLSALVAAGLTPGRAGAQHVRLLRTLARIGGAALLLGVTIGSARWIATGSLDGDGANGVVITMYFLVGGVLFSRLGWRPGAPRAAARPDRRPAPDGAASRG